MDETEVQFVVEDLCACRVCLATDVRLEALYPGPLAETYEQLTGTTVSPTDGLPRHLCTMCAALLKKSAAFRHKCRNTHDFLQRVRSRLQPMANVEITMPLIRSLDRDYLKLPYGTSEMITASHPITDEKPVIQVTKIELKQEESEEDCVDYEAAVEPSEEGVLTDLNMTDAIHKTLIEPGAEAYAAYPTLLCDSVLENKDSCNDECDMFEAESNTVVGGFKTKGELREFTKTYNFDVVLMTEHEQTMQLELSRKSMSYRQGKFKCEECFRGFKSDAAYKSHMTVHDPASGSHVCEVCKHRYPTAGKLTCHKLQHRLKFICQQCNQSFNDRKAARQHHRSHKGVSYDCQHCGATFRRYASRLNHIRIHHGSTTCDICYEGFQGANGMLQHKAVAHKKTYQCASCDVHFDNAHAMTRHIGSSPGGACDPNIRACAKCGEPCASAEQLDEHVARAHPQRRPGQNRTDESCDRKKKKSKERKCCCCPHFEVGKNGDGESVVPNSGACPCGDEEPECLCPLGSARSCRDRSPSDVGGALGRNRWAHKGCCHEWRRKKMKIMCELCAATFQSAAKLRVHVLIHTGEKPFQCSECHKRFRLKEYLQTHMNSHTGERPYKCSLCPKAFTTVVNRFRHQLVHSQARRHSCEVCAKTFKTSTDVKTHVRTVHMKITQPRRGRTRKRKIECTDSE